MTVSTTSSPECLSESPTIARPSTCLTISIAHRMPPPIRVHQESGSNRKQAISMNYTFAVCHRQQENNENNVMAFISRDPETQNIPVSTLKLTACIQARNPGKRRGRGGKIMVGDRSVSRPVGRKFPATSCNSYLGG